MLHQQILQNYGDILQKNQFYLQDKRKLTNVLAGLLRCLSLVPCNKKEVDSCEKVPSNYQLQMYHLFCELSFFFWLFNVGSLSISGVFITIFYAWKFETLHAIIFFICCHDHVISLLSQKPLSVYYLLLLKLVLLVVSCVIFTILVMFVFLYLSNFPCYFVYTMSSSFHAIRSMQHD